MSILEKIHNPSIQVAITVILSCVGTYIFSINGIRTIANAIWLFIFPAIIGIVLNDRKPRQVFMASLLMIVSALSSIALMVAVWGGY